MIIHCTCDISSEVVDVLLNSIIIVIKFNDAEARGGPIIQVDRDDVNQQSSTEFVCKRPWTRSLA